MEPFSEKSGADLVWSRYNAMIVADTVFLGFVAQVAINDGSNELLLAGGAVLGLIGTVFWSLITSYGWTLLHTLESVHPEYCKWRKKFFLGIGQDPIWWCAHIIIWLFYISYTGLWLMYLYKANLGLIFDICSLSVIVILFAWLVWYSLTRLSIKRFEKS